MLGHPDSLSMHIQIYMLILSNLIVTNANAPRHGCGYVDLPHREIAGSLWDDVTVGLDLISPWLALLLHGELEFFALCSHLHWNYNKSSQDCSVF